MCERFYYVVWMTKCAKEIEEIILIEHNFSNMLNYEI